MAKESKALRPWSAIISMITSWCGMGSSILVLSDISPQLQSGINMKITSHSMRLVRNFSWFSRMENTSKQKAQADFKKEITFMASKPTYTLVDFRQRVIDGLAASSSGIKAKFMQSDDKGEASMILQRKILNAMFEEELNNPELITGRPI